MNHALSRFTTRGCVALVLFVSLGSAMAAGFDTQYEVRYGHLNGDGLVDLLNVANSFSHAPFPGDGGFNSSDETYHHYDVETAICTTGQPGCDQTNLRAKLRYYSFPSYKLKPVKTNIDGERVMVRITLALFDTDDPEHYVVKGGEITQRFVESGIWQGAIQNVKPSIEAPYPAGLTGSTG